MIKTLSKVGIRGNICQHATAKTFNKEKLKEFPSGSGTRQECPLLSLFFNVVLEVLATVIRQEEIKGIQTAKEEVKLSLFADDLILYIKNPKDSTKKNTRTDQ